MERECVVVVGGGGGIFPGGAAWGVSGARSRGGVGHEAHHRSHRARAPGLGPPGIEPQPSDRAQHCGALLTSTGPLLVHTAAHGSIVQVFIHVVAVASALGRAVPQSRWPDGLSRC